MEQEIEIEFKNLLTYKEYDLLLHQYPFSDKKKQINYYFETEQLSLKEKKCALRIREKDGMYTLTLKEPHITGLLETHIRLTKKETDKCINRFFSINNEQMNEKLLSHNISPENLLYYGKLITFRREYHEKDNTLVLDHSYYNGQEDYEFEFEAADYHIGKKTFLDTLQQLNIDMRVTPNKIERFFNSLPLR